MFVEIKNGNLKLPKTDILLDDNKKLLARAIVWFNSVKPYLKNPRTFMDRIYYSEEQQQNIFKDFAKKNNWLYKKICNLALKSLQYKADMTHALVHVVNSGMNLYHDELLKI